MAGVDEDSFADYEPDYEAMIAADENYNDEGDYMQGPPEDAFDPAEHGYGTSAG
jgi:hypothetical protein